MAAANTLMTVLASTVMVMWAGIGWEKQAKSSAFFRVCDESGPSPIPASLQGGLVQEETPAQSLALAGAQLSQTSHPWPTCCRVFRMTFS